jgi:hypothetical protein
MNKSQRRRWAGFVAHMGGTKYPQRFGRRSWRREHMENLGLNWRIILKRIENKHDDNTRMWSGFRRHWVLKKKISDGLL